MPRLLLFEKRLDATPSVHSAFSIKYEITFAYTDAAQICHLTLPTASFSSGLLQLNVFCFMILLMFTFQIAGK